jgi:hypothetical protein
VPWAGLSAKAFPPSSMTRCAQFGIHYSKLFAVQIENNDFHLFFWSEKSKIDFFDMSWPVFQCRYCHFLFRKSGQNQNRDPPSVVKSRDGNRDGIFFWKENLSMVGKVG